MENGGNFEFLNHLKKQDLCESLLFFSSYLPPYSSKSFIA